MTNRSTTRQGWQGQAGDGLVVRGFSLIELLTAMLVVGVMAAISVPVIQNTLKSYRLNAAASALAGAIRTTRYQAIEAGCPYTLTLTTTSDTYQLATQIVSGTPPACAASFSNVGGTIPWSKSAYASMNPATTLQFSPNGIVTATTGSLTFNVTNGSQTKVITVSGVGNVAITSQ